MADWEGGRGWPSGGRATAWDVTYALDHRGRGLLLTLDGIADERSGEGGASPNSRRLFLKATYSRLNNGSVGGTGGGGKYHAYGWEIMVHKINSTTIEKVEEKDQRTW